MTQHHLIHRGATRAGLLAVCALLLAMMPTTAAAAPGERSPDGVWTDLGDAQQSAMASTNRQVMPEKYHVFQIDDDALRQITDAAPNEKNTPVKNGAVLSFPMPDGTFQRFAFVESPIVMDEALAELGDMRTYLAQGIDDPTATLRFDIGYWGFRAYGRTSQGTLWIDPWELGNRGEYISAWKHDFAGDLDAFACGVDDSFEFEMPVETAIQTSGDQLHIYRLIPTATGEYTVYFGGLSGAFAALTTTFNRINAIYEVDAAIRFVIVAWAGYDDPNTDPFPNGSVVTSALLDQNQATLDGLISSDQWDIGHILTQGGGGGLAQLGVACNDLYKGRGGTGRTTPEGDPFDVDYVAHEVGHQMSAYHTFNGSTSSCNGNRSSSAAYEPGSGTTIMAYAGICGAENVQANSDPYFHVKSLEQIIAFRNSTSCQEITATGNTPPVADAGADIVLPRETPFYVSAGYTDGDGDAVTYCWEQYDLGAASPPTDPYGPLFRSLNPTGDTFRYFPDLGQILDGTSDPWEIMPAVDRSLTLRVTVRDNRAGGGGVDDDEIEITVAGDPFRVTAPNGGEAYTAGHQVNVTWDVGGSQQADVIIWLLADFVFYHLASTPNDGEETVVLPCGITSADCRIWIDAATGVSTGVHYFDVSNAPFSLTDGLPDFAPVPNFPGWADAVAVSPINDQAQGNAPLPTELFGDTTSYLGFARGNYGDAFGCGDFVSSLRVDEVVRSDNGFLPAPGTGALNWNLATDISGGRHTIWQINDPDNLIPESDEANNGYARQWVFLPQVLPYETQQLRAAPPHKFAGTEHLPDGAPLISNHDAMRVPIGTFWRAAAVSNPDPDGDYDIYMYAPSTGPDDGISNVLFYSAAGGAYTDAVVINDNFAGANVYDAGVLNWDTTGSGYRLEHRGSSAVLEVGQEFARSVAEFQMLTMEELYVDASQLGSISVELKNVSIDQPVTLAVFAQDFVTGSIYNANYTAEVGPDGRAVVTFDATVSGFYGAVVYRHAYQGTDPFNYDLKLWQTPADLAAVTLPGSHAPLIPRDDTDIPIGDPVPAPSQLDGDTGNTVMYFHMANLGPVASQAFDIAWLFDGVVGAEANPPFPDEMPGDPSIIYSQGIFYFNIRGGRHTAGYQIDSQNTNLEIFEDNNTYAEQWVWLPTQLAPETYVMRTVPPVRDGGFDLVPDGLPLFDNVDGLRSQTFEAGLGDDGYFGAVAIVPDGPADLDLRLHDPTAAPDNGFDTVLEQSTWGGSSSEFVVIDFDGPHAWGNSWDAGVLRFADDAGYALQSVSSTFLNYDGLVFPSTFGPFAIPGGEVLGLFEFTTNPVGVETTFEVQLRNLAGNADLGLSVIVRDDETGFYNKSEAFALANDGGPGVDESVQITLPGTGYYGLVVWKVDHGDLTADAQFDLRFIDPTTVSVPDGQSLPTVTRIESVYPNPFNPQTTVLLAMRQAGRASVKVYDVQGRLVRTLADEVLDAGRHELRWNGTDNAGRSVPSGVYFVRAVHPDGMDHQRMSMIK